MLQTVAASKPGWRLRVQGTIPDVARQLQDIDEVEVVTATTGPYDLVLEVNCTSPADLYRLTGTVLRQASGVTSTETFRYIDIQKLRGRRQGRLPRCPHPRH
ncbi:Lrp/AsnC ligand binding domain-containing protein [Actinoallomurus sp. NPDC050550]|uniref:Lrp/AsnC ligand binding domain-containing protein n=1 Tax=Actinoallomurus sp. NPDC050550 TaxID=3154937 RepID=UPI0033D7CDE1